jgi:phage shock protein PspC (stress-responsive transcriptional regulator)
MKSAISVELDGATFALDERAFAALRSYLERAGARLGAHPDRAEVVAGLERSIASKLRQRAQSAATIDETAMLAALKDVGRVDGPALDDSATRDSLRDDGERRARKLYRLREGQQFAGVCTGLAAFAAVDVGVIRLIVILATVFSGGMLALVYVLLVFVMPIAHTDAEIAEAHGGFPRG